MSHEKIIKFVNSIHQIKLELFFNIESRHWVELLKHLHEVFRMRLSIKRGFWHPIQTDKLAKQRIHIPNVPELHIIRIGRRVHRPNMHMPSLPLVEHMKDQIARLQLGRKRRINILNVMRPIQNPIVQHPHNDPVPVLLLIDREHIPSQSKLKLLCPDLNPLVFRVRSRVDTDLLSLVRFILLGVALAGVDLELVVFIGSEGGGRDEDLDHVTSFGGWGHEEFDFFEGVVVFFCENDVCGDACVVCLNRKKRISMIIQNLKCGYPFRIGQSLLKVPIILHPHSDQHPL